MQPVPTFPVRTDNTIKRLLRRGDPLDVEAATLLAELISKTTPERIHICLESNTATRLGITARLNPGLAAFAYILARQYPGAASIETIATALWGPQSTNRSIGTIRTMKNSLNKRLMPLSAEVENQYGYGYRLKLNSTGV